MILLVVQRAKNLIGGGCEFLTRNPVRDVQFSTGWCSHSYVLRVSCNEYSDDLCATEHVGKLGSSLR